MFTIVLLASCAFQEGQPDWRDQLVPDSPCFRVNLLDGFDEQSTDELNDLYECVNQGNFAALDPVMAAMDSSTREEEPAGIDLARLLNHLPELGLDLGELLNGSLELLNDPEEPIIRTAELLVELCYGQPYDDIFASGTSHEEGSLDGGLVVPALPLVGQAAQLALDGDGDLPLLMADLLEAELSADAVATLVAAAGSEDEPLATLSEDGLRLAGAALLQASDTSNDHSPSASGNSLRDMLSCATAEAEGEQFGGGELKAEVLLAPAATILDDEEVRPYLLAALERSYRAGDLHPLPQQLIILAEENIDGEPLEAGQDSALVILLRLLEQGNQPVTCSFLFWDVLETDNFSVWLLELLAEQEPTSIDSSLDLLGETLTWEDLVDALASQCTIDSQQFAADVPVLNRLTDPKVGNLLMVLLELLQALRPEEDISQLPALVELLALIHTQDLTTPVEELVKDVGDEQLVSLIIDLVPVLLDPWSDEAWCANGSDSCLEETWAGYDEEDFAKDRQPVDLESLFDLPSAALSPTDTGASFMERMRAALATLVALQATWDTLYNGATLVNTPGARSADLLLGLADMPTDGDWDGLSGTADLLRDEALTEPVLRIAETQPLRDALGATSSDQEGPLPFLSRLVTDGTLAEALRTVALLLNTLLEAQP